MRPRMSCWFVVVILLAPIKNGVAQEVKGQEALYEALLAVRVNGQEFTETALVLRHPDGRVFARPGDLTRWRLPPPDGPPFSYEGETYVLLNSIHSLIYHVDEAKQALMIEARPEAFLSTELTGGVPGLVTPQLPPVGGFLNYDVFVQGSGGTVSVDTVLESGIFHKWGVVVNHMLGRDLSHNANFVRLNTTWTIDWPSRLESLRLGDAVSRAGSWGRSVQFGGVQWASNFATQPSLMTFPLPTFTGEAVLPSTVDLYINDALRLRREVPPGPFVIDDLPVVTGSGDVQLVVRDVLGRERITFLPYYAPTRLLSHGRHDYSYELGFIRNHLGTASFDYGRFLAVGLHRYGFTDGFTGEVRAEFLRDQQTVGVGGTLLWSAVGVFSASLAGSRSHRGEGGLLALGFERQTQSFSFGGRTQLATEAFTQVGLPPGRLSPRQISQAFMGLSTRSFGSFGVGYVYQDNRQVEDAQFFTANYSIGFGQLGFFNLSWFQPLGRSGETAVSISLTRSFGQRTSASINMNVRKQDHQATLRLQRNLPAGPGFGYRVLASMSDAERYEAGVSLQNTIGTYRLEAVRYRDQTSFRAHVSGGFALLGWQPFFTRRLDASFAAVQVPGYPNVRVYAENQLVARTNSSGYALLPRLRPYEQNTIRLEQADLPLDAQIERLELDAIPYFRSGLVLRFPVRRSRGALFRIVLESGEPLPAGAQVEMVGQAATFPVALDGEVYATGLEPINQVRAAWLGQSCTFTLAFAETADPLPHLGTFTCRGVQP